MILTFLQRTAKRVPDKAFQNDIGFQKSEKTERLAKAPDLTNVCASKAEGRLYRDHD
jgi:hypothetical protein